MQICAGAVDMCCNVVLLLPGKQSKVMVMSLSATERNRRGIRAVLDVLIVLLVALYFGGPSDPVKAQYLQDFLLPCVVCGLIIRIFLLKSVFYLFWGRFDGKGRTAAGIGCALQIAIIAAVWALCCRPTPTQMPTASIPPPAEVRVKAVDRKSELIGQGATMAASSAVEVVSEACQMDFVRFR